MIPKSIGRQKGINNYRKKSIRHLNLAGSRLILYSLIIIKIFWILKFLKNNKNKEGSEIKTHASFKVSSLYL